MYSVIISFSAFYCCFHSSASHLSFSISASFSFILLSYSNNFRFKVTYWSFICCIVISLCSCFYLSMALTLSNSSHFIFISSYMCLHFVELKDDNLLLGLLGDTGETLPFHIPMFSLSSWKEFVFVFTNGNPYNVLKQSVNFCNTLVKAAP